MRRFMVSRTLAVMAVVLSICFIVVQLVRPERVPGLLWPFAYVGFVLGIGLLPVIGVIEVIAVISQVWTWPAHRKLLVWQVVALLAMIAVGVVLIVVATTKV